MQRLEVLGWWFSPFAPSALPRPQLLVRPWQATRRDTVLRYLRRGRILTTYPKASFCRFACGEIDMGTRDLTDGRFVWPDGLAHYVASHDVGLPEHFIGHVLANDMADDVAAPPRPAPKARFGSYDSGPWQRWALGQQACLDLEGFERPDPATCERIAREIEGVAYEQILLCRGATREVVLALRDGAIELRQLRVGGCEPRRFAGWHEWPIAGHA